jgi:hypothetical protein
MLGRLTYDGKFQFKSREMERTWEAEEFIAGLSRWRYETGGVLNVTLERVQDLQGRFAALNRPVHTDIVVAFAPRC